MEIDLERISKLLQCPVYGVFNTLQEASLRAHKLSKDTDFKSNRDFVRVGLLTSPESTTHKYHWAVV